MYLLCAHLVHQFLVVSGGYALGYNNYVQKNSAKSIIQNVKASYSQFAGEFDVTRREPWPEFEHFLTYVKKHAKVLDLGCGTGRLYDFLRPKEIAYFGIDHNSQLLDLARKNFPEAGFELADMTALKLELEAFDNVFCVAAFHHIPTKKMRKKVLADIHRVLKPDGILILTAWNLFQFRYLSALLLAVLRSVLSLGLKGGWNDLWVRWGNYPLKRYYHAFLPFELKSLFESGDWKIEEFYFTRKGKRVTWIRSFNLILMVRKK